MIEDNNEVKVDVEVGVDVDVEINDDENMFPADCWL